jgi:hypothetical protein
MTVSPDTDRLIENLAAGLKPVSPMTFRKGMVRVMGAATINVAIVAAATGLRPDLLAGLLSINFIVSNGVLLVLALAAASTAVGMASPQVGNQHEGWKWALAMAGLLPLAAVVTASRDWPASRIYFGLDDTVCALVGTCAGLLTAIVLIAWLRRGAPVHPERAGLLVGIAAGAIGIFGYGLHCPINSIVHFGVWHAVPVAVCGAVGRLLIPRILRW